MQAPTSFRKWRRPFGAEHSYVGLYAIFDSKAEHNSLGKVLIAGRETCSSAPFCQALNSAELYDRARELSVLQVR
jgi:hypothetical protein